MSLPTKTYNLTKKLGNIFQSKIQQTSIKILCESSVYFSHKHFFSIHIFVIVTQGFYLLS